MHPTATRGSYRHWRQWSTDLPPQRTTGGIVLGVGDALPSRVVLCRGCRRRGRVADRCLHLSRASRGFRARGGFRVDSLFSTRTRPISICHFSSQHCPKQPRPQPRTDVPGRLLDQPGPRRRLEPRRRDRDCRPSRHWGVQSGRPARRLRAFEQLVPDLLPYVERYHTDAIENGDTRD